MKRLEKLFFFVSFYLLAALQLYAATYYIDASLGNDSSSGKSITSPWKTINKISSKIES